MGENTYNHVYGNGTTGDITKAFKSNQGAGLLRIFLLCCKGRYEGESNCTICLSGLGGSTVGCGSLQQHTDFSLNICMRSTIRVGQNHIYTVYVRLLWQLNHQIYGAYRYTVSGQP
jgi:hypothetical protein